MKKQYIQTITFTALLIALGIALPRAAHVFGQGIGQVWLPINLAVLVAGLSLGPWIGLLLGVLSPLLSFAISGMPALPMLWFITAELAVYGLAGGLLRKKIHSVRISLLITQVAGRGAAMLALYLAGGVFGLKGIPAAAFVLTGTLTGLPGLVLQWAIIPETVKLMEKHMGRKP